MFKRPNTPEALNQARLQFIGADFRGQAIKVTAKTGEAVAWMWNGINGRFCAVVFLGKSAKPYKGSSFWFPKAERRNQFIAQGFECAAAAAARREADKKDRAAKRATPHALTVGAVLTSSWGYEQTNIDYYEVTKLVGSTMVEIRPIAKQSEETLSMQGVCVPCPGQYVGAAKRVRVSDYGERDSVRINSFSSARLEKPVEVGGVKVYKPSNWTAYA